MHIVIIGWAYVTLMMAISENSVIAGIMTFLLYGVLPLAIIIYLLGTGERRRRAAAERRNRSAAAPVPLPAQEQPRKEPPDA